MTRDVTITRLLAWFFAAAILVTGAISWATGDNGPVLGFIIAGAFMVPAAAAAERMLDVQPTVGCQCPMNAATGQRGRSPSCSIHGRGTPEWEECQPDCDLCEYEETP